MGDYKNQYEKYYSNLKTNIPSRSSYKRYESNENNSKNFNNNKNNNNNNVNRYFRKFVLQSVGAGILLASIFIIKNIPLEGAQDAYIISRETVDRNFNLTESVMAINIPELQDYKEKTLDIIDRFKRVVTGNRTVKEIIKEDYIVPVKGNYESLDGNDIGVVLQVNEETDVLSSYNGKVIEVNDLNGDKHVLIHHGNGVETYYGLLSSISVKVGDKVEKGQCIGRTGIVDSIETKGIVYKMIYMGIEKDPTELVDFSGLKRI